MLHLGQGLVFFLIVVLHLVVVNGDVLFVLMLVVALIFIWLVQWVLCLNLMIFLAFDLLALDPLIIHNDLIRLGTFSMYILIIL